MKFVDLQLEYQFYQKEIDIGIQRVLCSGEYLLGKELKSLEERFSKISGTKYNVGVKNCTDAIMLLIKVLLRDNPRATIILPNFGAYPTAVACKNFTDKLYYVDVDRSMTIDINKVPSKIRNGIVVAVNLFGNNCNEEISKYAKNNQHILIEDCAQSTGSGSGSIGDFSVFSFYPTKPLASMGDGGMICSNNDLEVYRMLRFYGQKEGQIKEVGINSRLDEIQSAIINCKIDKFHELNQRRVEIANRYKKHVKGIRVWSNCVYHQFVVMFRERNQIIDELKKREIPFMIHYQNHVSEMSSMMGEYNEVGYRVNDKILSLPCHPFLTEEEIQKVERFLTDFKGYEYVD